MTCDSVRDTTSRDAPGESAGVLSALVPPKGSAQLATDPGTSPGGADRRCGRPGYKANTLRRCPIHFSAGQTRLARRWMWLGGGDKAGGDGDGLHVAVIGSGGSCDGGGAGRPSSKVRTSR